MKKAKQKKIARSKPGNMNLEGFIKTLKISSEQERFLLDELPKMDGKERLELLEMLTKVYALNQEEAQSIKRLGDNWE